MGGLRRSAEWHIGNITRYIYLQGDTRNGIRRFGGNTRGAARGTGARARFRYEQNLTEQERSEMRQDLADVEDNAPVRKNDPRTSVQKAEEYRFASNIPGDQTIPEKEYADYTLEYDEDDAVMNGKIPTFSSTCPWSR